MDFSNGAESNSWDITGKLTIPAKNTDAIQDVPRNGVNKPQKPKWTILMYFAEVNPANLPKVLADTLGNTFTLTDNLNKQNWTLT